MKTFIQRLYTGGKFSTCVFLSFVMIIAFSCKKKPIGTTDSEDCVSLTPCNQVGFGYQYDIDFEKYYGSPFFNPNNENEFLYLKKYTPTYNSSELYTYNLLTNEKQLIYTGDIRYSPKWGQDGWIIFSKSDGNIYKIKSNSDSLIQLTNLGNVHHPVWNHDGSNFLAFTEVSNIFSILFDSNGNILDSIPFGQIQNANLQRADYIITNNEFKITLFNLNTNLTEWQYDYNYQNNSNTGGGSVFWLSDNEVIYCNINGLNRLNILSLSNQNFKKSCNSKVYQWGDINSSKTKMIWSRGDYTQIDECTLKYKSRIYIMNIDGSDETEINLE